MKKMNYLFFPLMIVLFVVGSCSSSDDETPAASAGCTVVSSCSATQSSDNISGIAGNGYLFGTYDKFIHASNLYTIDNSTGCFSDTSFIATQTSAGVLPAGTASFKFQFVVTGSSTFAETMAYYSDSSCATPILTYAAGYSNLTIGDNLSGLSVSGKPSTATKITYTGSCLSMYPRNDVGATFLNNLIASSGITTSSGTEYKCANNNGTTYHGLMNISDSSWDATANDNRTLLVDDSGTSAFSTWDDPSTATRLP